MENIKIILFKIVKSVARIIIAVVIIILLFVTVSYFLSGKVDNKLTSAKNQSKVNMVNNDLLKIKRSLDRYHDDKGKYPISLSELEPGYVPSVPIDILTNEPYNYSLVDEQNYKLCPKNVLPDTQKYIMNGEICLKNDSTVSQ